MQTWAERQDTFLEMEIACEEFREFCQGRFKRERREILRDIEIICSEIGRLSVINEETDEGCCNVCNTPLVRIDPMTEGYAPFFRCDSCPELMRRKIGNIDELVGGWAI